MKVDNGSLRELSGSQTRMDEYTRANKQVEDVMRNLDGRIIALGLNFKGDQRKKIAVSTILYDAESVRIACCVLVNVLQAYFKETFSAYLERAAATAYVTSPTQAQRLTYAYARWGRDALENLKVAFGLMNFAEKKMRKQLGWSRWFRRTPDYIHRLESIKKNILEKIEVVTDLHDEYFYRVQIGRVMTEL